MFDSRDWPTPKPIGILKARDPAVDLALRTQARRDAIRCSGVTQTYTELIFKNTADYTAFNTSTAEGSILGGTNEQPVIPAFAMWANNTAGKVFQIRAKGVLGTTSTPTIIFQVRLGTTIGSSFLSGASLGVSAAITTQSGVSNKFWELDFDMVCYTPGLGSGNGTLSGAGKVLSPGGFASPFAYALEPTTPDTATWTQTFDPSVTQYLNLSATWSASSSSNTITCKYLEVILKN